MRRVITLLLTIAMALSLVVVANATSTVKQSVYLKTEEVENDDKTVTYTFTLDASKCDGVGALQFDVKPADGLQFKSKTYPEGKKLQDVFEVVDFEGMKGSAGFHEEENRFIAYGSNAKANPPRVLKGTVVLASVTYTITDSSNCHLTVEGFKACFSGEKAALADGTGKYDCVAEPIDGGGSKVMLGDVNGDGKITISDVNIAFAHACGKKIITDPAVLSAADVTKDGQVTISDVNRIFAHACGKKLLDS